MLSGVFYSFAERCVEDSRKGKRPLCSQLAHPNLIVKKVPTTKNALLRYAVIDACLRRTNRRWPFEALREAVADAVNEQLGLSTGVSVRTLRNDLKEMRTGGSTGYEAPIAYDPERGYYYDPPYYSIFQNPLSLDDVAVLQQVLATLRQWQSFGLTTELDELLGRLEQRVSLAPGAEETPVIWFEKSPDYAGRPWLGPLYRAIRKRQLLLIGYEPFGAAEVREQLVHPHLLKEYNQRWFLLGTVPESSRPATLFALDRIRAMRPTDGVYEPCAVAVERLFGDVIGVSVPTTWDVQRVVLRFSPTRLPYVRTKPLHPSQVIREVDGDIRVELAVIPTRELVTLLLSFGADVEVLEPVELREEMGRIHRAALLRYGGSIEAG